MASLYLHVPFCKQKCLYCNFYSQTNLNRREDFVAALKLEIKHHAENWKDECFETIYFGGGTPSLLTPSQLDDILDFLHTHFKFSKTVEQTIEVNPESVNLNYFKALNSFRFNRLSIGVQSFNDNLLNFLGRTHNAAQATNAINQALNAGFKNLSVDLIYGIEGLSDQLWEQDLIRVSNLQTPHLSAYALTVEEASVLAQKIKKNKLKEPDEDHAIRQFKILMAWAEQFDFEHYEISNFALKGFRSKHNSNYWNHTPYLGLGPSAHSFFRGKRFWNLQKLSDYSETLRQGKPFYESEELSSVDLYNEFIMLKLRLSEGVGLNEVEACFGTAQKWFLLQKIQDINPLHYMWADTTTLKLTNEGKCFADGIAAALFAG